jgi:hypothetical protein
MLYWLTDWPTDWLTEWLAEWLYGTESVVPQIVKKIPYFMAPACSLLSPREAAICPYPELDEFISCRKILLFTMRYNVILPPRCMLPKWLFFFPRISHQSILYSDNFLVPSGHALSGVDLQPFTCWYYGFKSRRVRGCLSLVRVCVVR